MTKNFVIVGGSSGIGLQIARNQIAAGHSLTVLSRSWDWHAELPGVVHHAFDVLTDDLDSPILPERIDGLAYCPGSINLRSIRSLSIDALREDFEINVVGAVKVVQSALKNLKAAADLGSTSSVVFSAPLLSVRGCRCMLRSRRLRGPSKR